MTSLPVIRQSLLTNAACLHRFHRLQEGDKEPQSAFASRGTEFHKLHKIYVDYLCRAQESYDYDYAEQICAGFGEEATSLFRNWFPRQLIDYGSVYGTEVKLCLDADMQPCPEGGHAYSGEFDRLEIRDDTALIWDAKTHWLIHDPDDTIQAKFYAWLTKKTLPHIKTIKFELDFVRWGASRSVEYDSSDIDRIEREVILPQVQRIRDAVATSTFPATPCRSCAYCSLACPLLDEGITAEQIGRIENPEESANRLYVLEKRADRLKDQLKAYAIENGPITVGDGYQLGFQKRTTQEYSARRAADLNKEHGFDPYRALGVDNAEVKKIGKKYPSYASELEKTKKDKSTATFGFRSSDGKDDD